MKVITLFVLWIKYRLHICQEPGCWHRDSVPCYVTDWDEPSDGKPDYYYCTIHAHGEGLCWMCGGFYAGMESFDFSRDGLCDNCQDQWEAETGDRDYDDDDWWEEPDPYDMSF